MCIIYLDSTADAKMDAASGVPRIEADVVIPKERMADPNNEHVYHTGLDFDVHTIFSFASSCG